MKRPEQPSQKSLAELSILEYMSANPDAKDTAVRVMKWWIGTTGRPLPRLEIQRTLDHLVHQGWMIVREGRVHEKIYSLKQDRRLELRQILLQQPMTD